jgi:prepilin-type N-terminal cleavage/methylation domain-containing protein
MNNLQRAFSLVEIMVVIVIIMILAALMLPAAQGVKKKSYQTVCASNMRQLYAAMKLYEGDFDEYPPSSVVWPAFSQYYKTILDCPESTKKLHEYDYLIVGGPDALAKDYTKALLECREVRQGAFPLVRDKNHLIKTNILHPDSRLLLVRENGAFSVVRLPPNFDGRSTKPCNPIIGFESNL